MKFKIGDRVVLASGFSWADNVPYKTICHAIETESSENFYFLNGKHVPWNDDELKLYDEGDLEETDNSPKVQILSDEVGEYVDLELTKNNYLINVQFYIDKIEVKNQEGSVNGGIFHSPAKNSVTFDLRNMIAEEIKKKMTKEEIEKALGYKIEIVEG